MRLQPRSSSQRHSANLSASTSKESFFYILFLAKSQYPVLVFRMHAYDYPTHLPRLDYWYWYLVVAHSCALLSGELEPTRQDELSNVRMHIDNTKESSIEVRARTWIGRRTAGFRSKIEMTFCLLRGVLSRAHSYQRDLVRILT